MNYSIVLIVICLLLNCSNKVKVQENLGNFSSWIRDHWKETNHNIIESYDGWLNNLVFPQIGVKDSNIVRFTKTNYQDFVSKPNVDHMPNPLIISDDFFSGSIGSVSNKGISALTAFFGQHVFNEVLRQTEVSCPPEYVNIDIPSNHYYHQTTGHRQILFQRKRYDPTTGHSVDNARKQINEATPWIDGETIYGNSKVRRNYLVDFNSGKLRTTPHNNYPAVNKLKLFMDNYPPPSWNRPTLKPLSKFLATGDPNSNENPFLFAINVIWVRWHNHLIDQLSVRHPNWSGIRKFEQARKWVIAIQQHVIIDEWLPTILNQPLPEYFGYTPMLNPQASDLFSSIGIKYLYTLIPAVIRVQRLFNCQNKSSSSLDLRLCNTYFLTHELIGPKKNIFFDNLLLSLANHAAEKEDHVIVDDLRKYYYGNMDFTRRDAVADAIQSAREQGIPSYLHIRQAFNLTIYDTFDQLAKNNWPLLDKKLIDNLAKLYSNNVWKLDALVGCFLELSNGNSVTFEQILMEQFLRIRDGDRYWYKNLKNNLFQPEEIEEIDKITFKQIISTVTSIPESHLQPNVFYLPDNLDNKRKEANCVNEDREFSYKCDLLNNQIHGNQSRICLTIRPLDALMIEPCTLPKTFDYFKGSETWFIGTFVTIIIVMISFIPLSWSLVAARQRKNHQLNKKMVDINFDNLEHKIVLVLEWVGPNEEERPIQVKFDGLRKRVCLYGFANRKCLRQINLQKVNRVLFQCNAHGKRFYFVLKMLHEYDLVIRFDTFGERDRFCSKMERFLSAIGIGSERVEVDTNKMLRSVYTKKKRQQHVEMFFRAVFAHAFGLKTENNLKLNLKLVKNILNTELTQFEFAEALSMRSDSLFIQQMFSLIDKDQNGYLSFREFLDMMVVFAKGTAEQKAKLMFDMYDISGKGTLSKLEFSLMIRSMLELANQNISNQGLEQLVNSMYELAGFKNRENLNLADFFHILGDFKEEFNYLELNLEVNNVEQPFQKSPKYNRQSAIFRANETFNRSYHTNVSTNSKSNADIHLIKLKASTNQKQQFDFDVIVRFLDEKRWHIFWMILFHVMLIGLFLEKAYYYSFENKHQGLFRVGGMGIAITRGSASSIMFCFCLILLTMCRNLITILRETFLHHFIPFDSAVAFHKYVAIWAFILSIIHSAGHGFNFYAISTQSPTTLRCLFSEMHFNAHQLPKFQDWCFKTLTGITGICLLLLFTLICVFATPFARRHMFQAFWATHSLYPFMFLLLALHGLNKLIQPPSFLSIVGIPMTLFALDRLISLSRKKVILSTVSAEMYPSNVTYFELRRPINFEYRSGQWARIACLKLNATEYHPFTLASAPHEENLQFYIRAVGPFTKNLRQLIANRTLNDPFPSFYLDGPYGESHQDWSKFEISILVGGGIGVTPFASILKDIAFRSKHSSHITCRQIYFLWVTRTQKHFEWFVDIIRQVEQSDKQKMVNVHIFITQFQQKFDLRTLMLYVCERHFQKVSGHSLFTGLEAKTHFGRPDFAFFFSSLQNAFAEVNRIGVFSCGPNKMTSDVQQTCEYLNRKPGPLFIHHCDNF